MNLFGNETKEYLQNSCGFYEDWAELLSNYISIDEVQSILQKLSNLHIDKIKIYPEVKDVFKVFSYPFDKINVLIVGQDPYFNGNADGLAFSCKESLSPSLQKILTAIMANSSDMYNDNYFNNPDNWNLEYLAEQGVCLFNPSLTVEEGRPGSHENLWKEFSKKVLKTILENKKELVVMSWGRKAQESVASVRDSIKGTHLMMSNEHPAAARENRAWICDHFSTANSFLKAKGKEQIKWLK